MRRSILIILSLLLLAAATYALEDFSLQPGAESWGYSSEEYPGGGSYLGVDTRDVTADRLGPLHLKEESGVEVTMVDQDAPAGKAGIKEHDVILTLNGQAVESVEQLRRMIHEVPPGRVVSLGISRDGQPLTLKAQLADRKKVVFAYKNPETKAFKFAMPDLPTVPDMPDVPVSVMVVHSSVHSGLMVENLTSQLGDFFGAKNGQGVLVRSVEKGSRAEQAGFHAGDVIVKVNGQAVTDTGDFNHALHGRKDNTVNVGIIRDKKEQTLTLTLPERKQSGDIFENESFDFPDIDNETRIDLSHLDSDLADMQPQIALAMKEAGKAMDEAKKSLCREREKLEKHHELRQHLEEHQREFREQVRQDLDSI